MVEPGPAEPVQVTVRYFAAARAAAGVTEETVPVPPDEQQSHDEQQWHDKQQAHDKQQPSATVAAAIAAIGDRHGPELRRVLPRCSYLLDEVAVHERSTRIRGGQILDVLPPFAGG